MYKLPGIHKRTLSANRNPLQRAATRKKIVRANASKEKSTEKSRIIFKDDLFKGRDRLPKMKSRQALAPLHNLSMYCNGPVNINNNIYNFQYVGNGNYVYNGGPAFMDAGNISYDALGKSLKRKKKPKRSKTVTKIKKHKPLLDNQSPGTKILFEAYGQNLFEELVENEKSSHAITPLFQHDIKSHMRSRMVDWIVECFAIYKIPDSTFFEAIYVMDNYFQRCDDLLDDDDIHLIGLCSMFIATKYLDIKPICLVEFVKEIGHKTFRSCEVKKKELSILKTLEWNVNFVTPMHFLRYTMLLLKKQFDSPEYNPILEQLEKATIQYIKMAMINERLLKYSPSQLAFGAFSNACKYILDATNL